MASKMKFQEVVAELQALGLQDIAQAGEAVLGASELYKAIKAKIKEMRTQTHDWSVRERLCKLTSWGFWSDGGGEMMVSIDQALANKILSKLNAFVDDMKGNSDTLQEVADAIGADAEEPEAEAEVKSIHKLW